jgi:hypothetical protein
MIIRRGLGRRALPHVARRRGCSAGHDSRRRRQDMRHLHAPREAASQTEMPRHGRGTRVHAAVNQSPRADRRGSPDALPVVQHPGWVLHRPNAATLRCGSVRRASCPRADCHGCAPMPRSLRLPSFFLLELLRTVSPFSFRLANGGGRPGRSPFLLSHVVSPVARALLNQVAKSRCRSQR